MKPFLSSITRDPFWILRGLGVFTPSGRQKRTPTRKDILEVIATNGGTAKGIRFDRLDLSGVDLRGIDLTGASFEGSDLTNSIAIPLVSFEGNELSSWDLINASALESWEIGDEESLKRDHIKVEPTIMNNVRLFGATLKNANFNFVEMNRAFLREVRAEGTLFYKANLEGADFRFARLLQSDLRAANLSNADLYGVRLETNLLGSVCWGEKLGVHQERVAKSPADKLGRTKSRDEYWQESIEVYRTLMLAHQRADMRGIAGEFAYRRHRVQTTLTLERTLPAVKNSLQLRPTSLCWWVLVCRHGQPHRIIQWLIRSLWNLICGFGERPSRAFWLSVLIYGIGVYFYFERTSVDLSFAGCAEFLARLGNAILISMGSTFKVLGSGSWINQDGTDWQVFLIAIQSVLCTFLNATFLATGIRKWIR